MKELTILSGKGGTGKTTVCAAFAALATRKVLSDCDVDAADLHLLLDPTVRHEENFVGGRTPRIDYSRCMKCGHCQTLCRFEAIDREEDGSCVILPRAEQEQKRFSLAALAGGVLVAVIIVMAKA